MAKRNGKRNGRIKTPAKSPVRSNGSHPPLVVQPHGGAIHQGGIPGNAGGTGRPRSAIRDRAAQLYDEKGIAFLEQVVQGEKIQVDHIDMFGTLRELERRATIKERAEAVNLLGRVGLGEHKEATVEDVRYRLARTLKLLARRLSVEELERAARERRLDTVLRDTIAEMRPIWAA